MEESRGVLTNVLDCDIVVSEFELQSRICNSLSDKQTGREYEPPYPPSFGLNSSTTVFYQDGFGIE